MEMLDKGKVLVLGGTEQVWGETEQDPVGLYHATQNGAPFKVMNCLFLKCSY